MLRIRKHIWSAKRAAKAFLVDLLLALAERLGHREDSFLIRNTHFVEMPDQWWTTEVTPLGRCRTVLMIDNCIIIPKDVARRAGFEVRDT